MCVLLYFLSAFEGCARQTWAHRLLQAANKREEHTSSFPSFSSSLFFKLKTHRSWKPDPRKSRDGCEKKPLDESFYPNDDVNPKLGLKEEKRRCIRIIGSDDFFSKEEIII
ncbi:hypothetical protein AVEN_117118-1 [Araneus ventricosus]|uniref:Uncharacterized protein n=1 Tax=Araneus ventricosus TaxID=182803 RepID=A0A4Y2K8R8_ARAVE|nr:hypothetical protein AVEN_117118-1 [Araneus ventricosus]